MPKVLWELVASFCGPYIINPEIVNVIDAGEKAVADGFESIVDVIVSPNHVVWIRYCAHISDFDGESCQSFLLYDLRYDLRL